MSKAKKEGGKNRKYGRNIKSKSMARYKAENRSEKNKEKRIKRHAKHCGDARSAKQPHDFPTVPKNDPPQRYTMMHDVEADYREKVDKNNPIPDDQRRLAAPIFIAAGIGVEVERTPLRDAAKAAYDRLDVTGQLIKQHPDGRMEILEEKNSGRGTLKLGDKLVEYVRREEIREVRRKERKAERSKLAEGNKKDLTKDAAIHMRLVNPSKPKVVKLKETQGV